MHASFVLYDRTTYESIRQPSGHGASCRDLCCGGLALENARTALCSDDDRINDKPDPSDV